MSTLCGVVEFCQWDEWFAVIDAGAVLTKNSRLARLCFGAGGECHPLSTLANRGMPADMGEQLQSDYQKVRGSVYAETWAALPELESQVRRWQGDPNLAELLKSTHFLVLLELMQVLGRHWGQNNVRVVVYFD
ncbi:MAG: hypothetical protein U0271_45855 [Polyangiaceae bacterium]